MDIDIFIKTYKADFKWLKHALDSLSKHVKGYNELVIAVSVEDYPLLDISNLPLRTRIVTLNEYGNGYLYQQVSKLQAHKYCNSDFIMFGDSDCIFDHDIDLQEFIKDGKPEILYTNYSKVGDALCWKKPTETVLHRAVEWEFMRRNCLIYHRSTLANIDNWEKNLEFIIMNSERFSEFNLIGAYAYFHEFSKYNFINTDDWTYTQPKAKQYHSYTEFEKMLSELPK